MGVGDKKEKTAREWEEGKSKALTEREGGGRGYERKRGSNKEEGGERGGWKAEGRKWRK